MDTPRADALRQLLQARGVLGGAEIARLLQVSQPTVFRMVAAMGDAVVRMGLLAADNRGARHHIPHARISMHTERACDGGFVGWAPPVPTIP